MSVCNSTTSVRNSITSGRDSITLIRDGITSVRDILYHVRTYVTTYVRTYVPAYLCKGVTSVRDMSRKFVNNLIFKLRDWDFIPNISDEINMIKHSTPHKEITLPE